MHALISERYKYIRYHGLWDVNELYDLQTDPQERKNLIADASQQARVKQMNAQLFDLLEQSHGENLPLLRDRGTVYPWRHPEKSQSVPFPPAFFRRTESSP